ncbi:PA2169 family four-helix-bundle protein [Pendulispora brunnea]|uniref:PA2169 family four-helix-bundle protein n=1 Tax=Pendulispora brunnea TaxID=2905690 RepID=A0ABZ2K4F2_9BACT
MSSTETHAAEPKAIIAMLNKCIETCIDGQKGYGEAEANVEDSTLKSIFQIRKHERFEFVFDLQAAVRQLGGEPEFDGTAAGTVHRGWMGLRRTASGHRDRAIVEEWARGERAALKGYREALKGAPLTTLPPKLRTMLQAQYASIRAALDEASSNLAH